MPGTWTLRRESSQTHEFVGAAQVDLFAKLVPDPVLNHFAAPDDALREIRLELSRQSLLLTRSEDRRCPLIVRSAIPETVQTQGVIAVQDFPRT
ncbi:hypothetical protein DESA109040_06865 [Deinococcus saxicola]